MSVRTYPGGDMICAVPHPQEPRGRVFSGDGPPGGALGRVGDIYNHRNGILGTLLYRKTDSSTWASIL